MRSNFNVCKWSLNVFSFLKRVVLTLTHLHFSSFFSSSDLHQQFGHRQEAVARLKVP